MKIRADEMTAVIKEQLRSYGADVAVDEVGTILQVGDGIARISGLTDCMAGEMLEFPNGAFGLALNLEEESVGCVIMGDYLDLREGDVVDPDVLFKLVDAARLVAEIDGDHSQLQGALVKWLEEHA